MLRLRQLWGIEVKTLALETLPLSLSGPWRLLLLGDGSPTRHLESLSGRPVEIELIAMAPETAAAADVRGGAPPPPEVGELAEPLLRRQVWLRCGDQTLAWAESWWNQTQADAHLQRREQPIWRSLTSNRAELFREVDGLAQVTAPWLEQRFGSGGLLEPPLPLLPGRPAAHGDPGGVFPGPGNLAGRRNHRHGGAGAAGTGQADCQQVIIDALTAGGGAAA